MKEHLVAALATAQEHRKAMDRLHQEAIRVTGLRVVTISKLLSDSDRAVDELTFYLNLESRETQPLERRPIPPGKCECGQPIGHD